MQIADTVDEEGEGVLDIIDEDQLFCLLGLRTDDDQHDRPSEAEAQAAVERDSKAENRTARLVCVCEPEHVCFLPCVI